MLYTIEEDTLTALGDVVRDKVFTDEGQYYKKTTISIIADETGSGKYVPNRQAAAPDLKGRIKVKVKIIDEYTEDKWPVRVQIIDGIDYTLPYGTKEYEFVMNSSTDGPIYFTPYPAGKNKNPITFEVEAFALDDNDNLISKYTPLEMIEILKDLPPIPPDIVLTSVQTYGCAGLIASNYIRLFGDTITTNKITGCSNMFYNYQNDTIPFDINCSSSSTTIGLDNMFKNSKNLKEAPRIINARPSALNSIFSGCYRLKEIPDSFSDTWNWDYYHSYGYVNGDNIFSYCYSLRRIANNFLKNLWTVYTSTYGSGYKALFQNCYTLDEVKGLGVSTATYTGNMFQNTFDYCYRLKELTFETNEDGTPKTAKWKSQRINTQMFGYVAANESMLLNYNSGITADKKVVDDATYQALKDDPDWYSTDVKYARYNKASAINTINSLPDTSAYGTNNIDFDGRYGSLTDGGAISDLTAEEIAVATAKGWTVSLS